MIAAHRRQTRRYDAFSAVPGPRRRRRKPLRPKNSRPLPRLRWPFLLAGAGALYGGRKRARIGLPPAAATVLVATAPLTTAAAIGPGRLRRVAVWATQMWAYKIAFEAPHDNRARLQKRMHIDYPIAIDSAIGLGEPPGQRLQASLRRPPRITPFDWAMVGIYALWQLEPHAALALILWRRPQRFVAAATRLAATFDLTLVGYWAIPTSPPWWASEKAGRMGGVIRRVVLEAKRELRDEPRPGADHEVGANPWAAMPSDHFATALATASVLFDLDRRLGAAALVYAGALGFALVYLGEHYVADLLAGLGLAVGVREAAPALTPVARAIATCWPHP